VGVVVLLSAGIALVFDAAVDVAVGLSAALAFCSFAGLDLKLSRKDLDHAIMQTGTEAIFDIDAYLVIGDPAEEKISHPLLPGPLARHAIIPGVEVSIAAVPHNPSEADQSRSGPTTAGHIRQFALVKVPQTP
jgi:hypothetical protein